MNDWTYFKEQFFISFIILSNFISSNNTNWIIIFDSMSFLSEKTFFCFLIFLKPNITMVSVGFFFWIFPISLSWEELNVKNFSKAREILGDFFFTVIVRNLVDINLVIGEAFFKRDCLTCNFNFSNIEKLLFMFLSGLCVCVVFIIFFGNYDFSDIKFSFRILFVECTNDLFFRFCIVHIRNFREENVGDRHSRLQPIKVMFINWK